MVQNDVTCCVSGIHPDRLDEPLGTTDAGTKISPQRRDELSAFSAEARNLWEEDSLIRDLKNHVRLMIFLVNAIGCDPMVSQELTHLSESIRNNNGRSVAFLGGNVANFATDVLMAVDEVYLLPDTRFLFCLENPTGKETDECRSSWKLQLRNHRSLLERLLLPDQYDKVWPKLLKTVTGQQGTSDTASIFKMTGAALASYAKPGIVKVCDTVGAMADEVNCLVGLSSDANFEWFDFVYQTMLNLTARLERHGDVFPEY
jgi:hypothetical protein